MRALAEITRPELKEAICAYVESKGMAVGADLAVPVARMLDADVNDPASLGLRSGEQSYSYAAGAAKARFFGKVRLAATELADEARLFKVPAGGTRPNGRRAGKQSYYYTRARWDAEAAEATARWESYEATKRAWRDIGEALQRRYGVSLDDRHRLSVSDWKYVLGMGREE